MSRLADARFASCPRSTVLGPVATPQQACWLIEYVVPIRVVDITRGVIEKVVLKDGTPDLTAPAGFYDLDGSPVDEGALTQSALEVALDDAAAVGTLAKHRQR